MAKQKQGMQRIWIQENPFYGGLLLIALGILFFLNEFGFSLNLKFLWPLFLIITGIVMVVRYNGAK